MTARVSIVENAAQDVLLVPQPYRSIYSSVAYLPAALPKRVIADGACSHSGATKLCVPGTNLTPLCAWAQTDLTHLCATLNWSGGERHRGGVRLCVGEDGVEPKERGRLQGRNRRFPGQEAPGVVSQMMRDCFAE